MTDERITELMNQEVDGANTADESRELSAYLEEHPEERARLEELRTVGRMFGDAGDVEPPAALHGAIMASLAAERAGELRKRAHQAVTAMSVRSVRPRIGFAFAAGLVSGACLLALVLFAIPGRGPIDPSRLTGTLVSREAQEAVREPVAIQFPGGRGAVRIADVEGGVEVDIALVSDEVVRITLEHGEGLRYGGVRVPGGEEHSISVAPRRVEIMHSGDSRYVVALRSTGGERGAIRLRVSGNDGELFEETVRPRRN